jgi:histidinol phosphatase-like enzyme (inositol monophosphatase family)
MSADRDPQSLMQAVADVARAAGKAALSVPRDRLAAEAKADGSPVTAADREAERQARAWIESRFGADGILGEEFGVVRPEARWRWIVDPIDGTKSFVRGVPLWGSLAAVAEGDRVVAGAAYFPVLEELVAAGVGCGCWHQGARCRVSEVADLARSTVLVTDDLFPNSPERRQAWARLASAAALARTWGDCYGYLLVATGRAEVMADPVLAPWDSAPLVPIIAEAGGVLTDWQGSNRGLIASAIATNALLAGEVRTRLGVPPAPGRD